MQYKLQLIAQEVNREPRDARLVRHGTQFTVLPARRGYVLDTAAAERTVVRALASLDRQNVAVELPFRIEQPTVRAAALGAALRNARLAVSAPLRLQLGKTRWLLTPRKIAPLLQLPADGRSALAVGGPAADAWLEKLGKRVERPAEDAAFAVDGSHVHVVPAKPGLRSTRSQPRTPC